MKQVIQNFRSGVLKVDEVPETICKSGGVLVRNVASLISAGTEKMAVDFAQKSLVGKAQERPDLVRQVLSKLKRDGVMNTINTVRARLDAPLALGYSCAGVVREVGRGVTDFTVGDRVACAGMNYASHAETVFVPQNLTARIPDGVGFDEAAFVTLGAIALQGVRTAEVKLGDAVAVIGLGLLGQLTVLILKAAGARVIGIDLDHSKVELALAHGPTRRCGAPMMSKPRCGNSRSAIALMLCWSRQRLRQTIRLNSPGQSRATGQLCRWSARCR